VMLRTDFSGIYPFGYRGGFVSLSDHEMTNPQKGTDYNSYLILHQKGMQINGCYVHGKYINKNDGSGYIEVISDVIGYVRGNIKNNVLHFSRSSVEFHDIRKGLMALTPTDEAIGRPEIHGYFIVLRDSESENEIIKKAREQGFQSFDGTFNFRYADNTNVKCAPMGKVRFDNVYFNFNSARLTSESKAALDKFVDAALAYPQWKFEISGHTDSTGSNDYNLNLSEKRATVVKRYLVTKGLDETRIQTKSYGATRILESNPDQSINRRVEISQQ
jgi:outer membrane protein OmpA-like peptidoglycan-associated protein